LTALFGVNVAINNAGSLIAGAFNAIRIIAKHVEESEAR
jgi:hypothetical protein